MGLARSTYYDEPQGQPIEEARLVERIKEICAEWPSYGYRRVRAQLRDEGTVVNHKKVMRLMQEHELTVRPRRRFVATKWPPACVLNNANSCWPCTMSSVSSISRTIEVGAVLEARLRHDA